MRAAVLARLKALGYKADDKDKRNVDYNIKKAEAYLKNNLNREDVPEELNYTLVDIAAGLFLSDKKSSGQLNAENGFDFSPEIKSVTEGDVTVSYMGNSKPLEAQFDTLIQTLTRPKESQIGRFRRLLW